MGGVVSAGIILTLPNIAATPEKPVFELPQL